MESVQTDGSRFLFPGGPADIRRFNAMVCGIAHHMGERILDLLERNEAALRAKLQAQENAKRRKAKRQKIEKDW